MVATGGMAPARQQTARQTPPGACRHRARALASIWTRGASRTPNIRGASTIAQIVSFLPRAPVVAVRGVCCFRASATAASMRTVFVWAFVRRTSRRSRDRVVPSGTLWIAVPPVMEETVAAARAARAAAVAPVARSPYSIAKAKDQTRSQPRGSHAAPRPRSPFVRRILCLMDITGRCAAASAAPGSWSTNASATMCPRDVSKGSAEAAADPMLRSLYRLLGHRVYGSSEQGPGVQDRLARAHLPLATELRFA